MRLAVIVARQNLLCTVQTERVILNLGAHSRFAVVKSQALPGIQRAYIRTPLHDLTSYAGAWVAEYTLASEMA
jgi:hypothetical protein